MQEKTVFSPEQLAEEIHSLMLEFNTKDVSEYFRDFEDLVLKRPSQYYKGEAGRMNFGIVLGIDDESLSVVFMYSKANAQWEMEITELESSARWGLCGVESWAGVPVDDVFPKVVDILEENLNPGRAE